MQSPERARLRWFACTPCGVLVSVGLVFVVGAVAVVAWYALQNYQLDREVRQLQQAAQSLPTGATMDQVLMFAERQHLKVLDHSGKWLIAVSPKNYNPDPITACHVGVTFEFGTAGGMQRFTVDRGCQSP